MYEYEKKELASQSTDIVLSAAGSLVGFAMGGPVGSIVGGALSPTAKLAIKVGELWIQRRQMRLTSILERAFQRSGRNEEEILQEMIDSPDWCNTIIEALNPLFSRVKQSRCRSSQEVNDTSILFSPLIHCRTSLLLFAVRGRMRLEIGCGMHEVDAIKRAKIQEGTVYRNLS